MKLGRNLIIGAILSLGTAGAIAPAVAMAAPAAATVASAPGATPNTWYHM